MEVDWTKTTATSQLHASLQTGPGFGFGDWKLAKDKPFYAEQIKALGELKADFIRYQGWHNRPDLTVAAAEPPKDGKTSWDFSRIDPPFRHFLKANGGRPFVMNFSTPPAWAKTPQQTADYFARFASWYVQGGFVDEAGQKRRSGHDIALPYWEVLNEPDFEKAMTPEAYTERYDAIVEAVHRASPDTRFIGLALSSTLSDPRFTTHFLNPNNHRPGVPLDYVSYHFYAVYRADQSPAEQAAAVFAQADQFLDTLRYIAAIRDELSPSTGIMVTEIGAMNQGARPPRQTLGFEAQLGAAMYAYLHARMAGLGVEAAHVSGMVAVQPDQMWQEMAMIDWQSGRPNVRYWSLKLLIDRFGPGAKLAATRSFTPPPYPLPPPVLEMMAKRVPVFAQGFATAKGERRVLLVNRSTETVETAIPGGEGAKVEVVDQVTATAPARVSTLADGKLALGGLAIAVATLA